jgi:hypothetical protein
VVAPKEWPEKRDVVESKRVEHLAEIHGKPRQMVAVVGLIGLTLAARIEGDDAVAVAQAGKLMLELDCRL